jgi:hypothetical protein
LLQLLQAGGAVRARAHLAVLQPQDEAGFAWTTVSFGVLHVVQGLLPSTITKVRMLLFEDAVTDTTGTEPCSILFAHVLHEPLAWLALAAVEQVLHC